MGSAVFPINDLEDLSSRKAIQVQVVEMVADRLVLSHQAGLSGSYLVASSQTSWLILVALVEFSWPLYISEVII